MVYERPSASVILHIDGASRGNPGLAACAVVVRKPDGSPLDAFSKYLGETTNNVAEYGALLAALEYARGHQYRRLKVVSDSELLTRQIEGRYRVRSEELKPLYERAQKLIAEFESFSIEHVSREGNREPDRIANEALDAAERGERSKSQLGRTKLSNAVSFRTSATYHHGALQPEQAVPLLEGEKVDLEIRRRK